MKELKKLKRLYLDNNQLKEVSGLSILTNQLIELTLFGNKIPQEQMNVLLKKVKKDARAN